MKDRSTSKRTVDDQTVGQEIIASLKEAIAWADGEDVPVRVTTVQVPSTDVRRYASTSVEPIGSRSKVWISGINVAGLGARSNPA